MEANVTELKGGKEIGLLELRKYSQQLGYSVPKFFVLPDLENEEELIKIVENLKGNDIIVRSNSIMENNEFGFDGIYESFVLINWNIKMLKEASQEVLDSLYSEEAIAYRNKAGLAEDSMRVIVQKFIGNKNVSDSGKLQYFVMETSINAQGDISVVVDEEHDFVNCKSDYEELIMGVDGEILTFTIGFNFFRERNVLKRLQTIAMGLGKVFGPVSLEGAFIENRKTGKIRVFLFQRRLLAKEFYQAQPEIIPAKYLDKDVLFRSNSYRGAGKIENLPVIVMPTIKESVNEWENELKRKISQLKSDVILFVSSMHLGRVSSKILNDYTALSGVKAIVSFEKIDFSSHAFKVASLARIPFVSVDSFSSIETLSRGSLFFTKNEAVFCLDEKREDFKFDRIKKSEATSLVKEAKKKGVVVKFLEEEQKLSFDLDLIKFSFNDFGVSFHRLLEDVSGEIWLLGAYHVGSIGFKCENSKGQIIVFSGWANYIEKEGHLNLCNFREDFENNQIEWSLIQKIVTKLDV